MTSSYALIDRHGKPTDPHEQSSWTNHIGPTGFLGGKSILDVDYKDLDESGAVKYDSAAWLGFTDKYWHAALVPAPGARVDAPATGRPTWGERVCTHGRVAVGGGRLKKKRKSNKP